MQAPINGAEERLDRQQATLEAIVAELRAIRALIAVDRPELKDAGSVELKEPARRRR